MLQLIKEELLESGVSPSQFISVNFENMGLSYLHTAQTLRDEILKRTANISGKAYLFFDEIQEVAEWEKCVNSLRVALDCDIYITGSNAKLLFFSAGCHIFPISAMKTSLLYNISPIFSTLFSLRIL